MKNIAIIPARSGSQRLKDKNIKDLDGKPLIAYTIQAAYYSGLFDEIVVSTDSPLYAEIAEKYGASVPFLRESGLAKAETGTWEVVFDVLDRYAEQGEEFDNITLLQVTSPLRTADDIKNAYKLFEEKKAVSVIGVCQTDHSPLIENTLPEDRCLKHFFDGNNIYKRSTHNLPIFYKINGAIYIVKTEELRQNLNNLYGEKSYAFVMSKEHSVDIDDELDFIIAKAIIEKNKIKVAL
ncbi:MAG: CMP-N-acetlyneuraminic acid synthetase [Clostridiales bacterium]|nr:MAG: CMP-N-acetlyneuraminic acid synthetase [Clostridiales bacterium]